MAVREGRGEVKSGLMVVVAAVVGGGADGVVAPEEEKEWDMEAWGRRWWVVVGRRMEESALEVGD
jgi:hypothetical protein